MAVLEAQIIPIITAILTLMVWSCLYKDNPFYKISERLVIGLYLAYQFKSGLDVLQSRFVVPTFVELRWTPVVIAFIIGILSWTRFVKGGEWLARWPIAILTAIGAGVAVQGAIGPQILTQIGAGLNWYTGDAVANINNIIMSGGAFFVLSYFLYTVRQTGGLRVTARIGRAVMMIAFGTMFANMLMSNTSMSIGVMFDLTHPPGVYVTAIAVIVMIIDIIYSRSKPVPMAPPERE